MAKSSSRTEGTSRIRFVMVEAEIADGDIGQITQAISSALRGSATTTIQRVAPANVVKAIAQEATEVEPQEHVADETETGAVSRAPKQRGPRKAAAMPEAIQIDADTHPTLTSYAEKTKPTNHHKRFLVIAAWFKECRSIDSINANHVFTCYRLLGWPTNLSDFSQPLRDLKARQLLTVPEKGQYAINQLGLHEVAKLMSGGG